MKTSLIIAYHNEGMAFIHECVQSIKNTIKDLEHEIIIVDDCSDVPCEPISGTRLLRNPKNIGIGRTFDRGVEETNGENIILLACDIRFKDNNWAERLVNRITENPKSFICTKCVNYVDHDKWGTGASLYLRHDANVDPKRDKDFRDILNTSWLSIQGNTVAEIPCLLGAIYGVSREWYKYTEGWRGFRRWGTLEAYISLKSWLFGGKCLVDTSIDTYHIYKERHPHGTSVSDVISNKIKISRILRLPGFEEYLPDTEFINRAKAICDNDREQIEEMRRAYVPKIVFTIYEYAEKFGLKLPDNKESSKITPSYIKKECDAIYSKAESSYTKPYEKSAYIHIWNNIVKHLDTSWAVCDIGCGVGQFMSLLRDAGVTEYTGIDISGVAINKAREKISASMPGFKVIEGNVFDMDIPKADLYVMTEILEHIHNDIALIEKLPKGANLVLTVPDFLGGSHVRKFENIGEVISRYTGVVEPKYTFTDEYIKDYRIFTLIGIKR